jgi:hypothetical protein
MNEAGDVFILILFLSFFSYFFPFLLFSYLLFHTFTLPVTLADITLQSGVSFIKGLKRREIRAYRGEGKCRRCTMFATVPDSRINSWESWFIFNLRKINTNQYYESDSQNAGIVTHT